MGELICRTITLDIHHRRKVTEFSAMESVYCYYWCRYIGFTQRQR